ncbi:MAG: DUF456 domain-containing protein [Firmicutes bacterium]|nr:DUF456 domain-containing protein [Bacillota bacterium]
MDWLALTVALVIMFIGLAGTLLPMVPGAPLVMLGIIVYGFMGNFHIFGTFFWIGQTVLLLMVFGVDYMAGAIGAKYYGGTKYSIWGSIIGGLVGLFTLGPLGVIVGPFIGAVVGEMINQNSLEKALKSGIGTLIGFAGGTLVKIAIEITMIVWFLFVVL